MGGIYRKRSIEIEAYQFNNKLVNGGIPNGWIKEGDFDFSNDGTFIIIPARDGNMICEKNDWIIKGSKGEFYPVKNDIFNITYDLVKVEFQ